MSQKLLILFLALSALGLLNSHSWAQPPGGGRGGPPRPERVEPQAGARIAWYGTVAGGLAEAKRLQRPVLLVSAAPHCRQVPGVW
ncbi:MAG: hypothetical protein AAF581_07985 [Planctomycetota bacterium]